MSGDAHAAPGAAALDEQVLDLVRRAPAGFVAPGQTRAARYGLGAGAAAALDRDFDRLAVALFEHQAEHVPVYRRYARLRGIVPGAVEIARQVPALPVEAFKRARIATFPPQAERASFHTSGTTGDRPGVLHLDGFALYDAALERAFRHHVLPDRERMRLLVLAPPPAEAPHSSLGYMLARLEQRCGAPGSATLMRDGTIQWRELGEALRSAAAAREPVGLLGTTFAWVQVLDRAAAEGFRVVLPPGSRLFETGGTKGRSRETTRAEVCAAVERIVGIPPAFVVGEYGMTEMGSQYYTLSLRSALCGESHPDDGTWSYPGWLRPRLVDPESGEPRDPGRAAPGIGLLAHHDLANRSSVAHLLTADLGRARGASFELLGRAPRAEPRGCGLVFEEGAP
jgi:hypothetical protein